MLNLILILQSKSYLNARQLAERCGVSRRTIYRDLEILADTGVPVRFRSDRQGYELAKTFFLPPTSLNESEALALLILGRQWRIGDGLGLARQAWNGAVKLAEGLPVEVRERVMQAAEPFHSDNPPPEIPPDRRLIQESLLEALSRQRQVRLWYRDAEMLTEESTKFSVFRFVLHDGLWHVVGRSSLHRRVEIIGVAEVRKAAPTDDPSRIPPRFNLERFLGKAWGVVRSPLRYRVWLRFASEVAPRVEEFAWNRGLEKTVLEDGRVDLHFVVEGLDEVTRWILGFGDDVEVRGPSELRERLYKIGARMAHRYDPGSQR